MWRIGARILCTRATTTWIILLFSGSGGLYFPSPTRCVLVCCNLLRALHACPWTVSRSCTAQMAPRCLLSKSGALLITFQGHIPGKFRVNLRKTQLRLFNLFANNIPLQFQSPGPATLWRLPATEGQTDQGHRRQPRICWSWLITPATGVQANGFGWRCSNSFCSARRRSSYNDSTHHKYHKINNNNDLKSSNSEISGTTATSLHSLGIAPPADRVLICSFAFVL